MDATRQMNPTASEPSSGGAPQVIVVAGAGRQTVWWVLAVLLAILTTAVIMRWDDGLISRPAWAQATGSPGGGLPGTRGIYAFTGQITSRSYGVFMIDVDTGTLWCYELQRSTAGSAQLQLVAARSWIYDRFLEEFNTADPIPSEVRAMVQQQQQGGAPGAAPQPAPVGGGAGSGPSGAGGTHGSPSTIDEGTQ